MSKLLRFELYKLIRHKAFIICSSIILGLNIFTVVMLKILANFLGEDSIPISGGGYVLMTMGSSFSYIICAFTAVFVCSDYEQETIKNIYARGFTRTGVFFAKYIAVIAATVAIYLVVALFNFILGSLLLSGGQDVDDLAVKIVLQILLVWAYTSLAFMFGMLFKRNGPAISLSIVTPLVITVILTIVTLIIDVSNLEDAFLSSVSLNSYWLDGITSSVSVSIIDLGLGAGETTDMLRNYIMTIVYAVGFTGFAFLANCNSDK